MHPPHLSAFIDHDGDGVADQEKVLVKGIAFDFKDRPADHTSNGLELGIDGWIYCAIGDFGFMEAEGTDGRKLQLRGGGVVRVRPDGTGLELFARGTRNILEAAVSPLLDIFARDNTNDGGGWDVRFHHFTGLEEHGYPTLFKNFNDEIIQPLADYGGGSGCGAAWIDEPGIPAKWNNSPFTADWGRNWVYQHRVTPNGATFKTDQTEFFAATRVTDLDVDALSNIYIASWKGATFTWAGPDVGYIVRLTPKGYTPEPLPNINVLGKTNLIKLLESPSTRLRLAAQRALLRSGLDPSATRELIALAGNHSKPLVSRVAAIFALKQGLGIQATTELVKLAADPSIEAWALRALTDRADQLAQVPSATLVGAFKSNDARTRREAVVSVARLGNTADAAALVPLLGDHDPVIAHTAVQALKRLDAADVCFATVDTQEAASPERTGALRVLQSLHETSVVDGLIARLGKESDFTRRQGLLTALCRLYFTDGEWKGNSWGTRPDTSGPMYQPVEWSGTPRIASVLKANISNASPAETAFLAGELDRHKIRMDDALGAIITLAQNDASQLPIAMKSLANASTIPDQAIPLLIHAATAPMTAPDVRANAVNGLARVNRGTAIQAMFTALNLLDSDTGADAGQYLRTSGNALINAPHADEHVTNIAEQGAAGGAAGVYADAALMKISGRKNTSPEARAAADQALDQGWNQTDRRAQILNAVAMVQQRSYRDKVIEAAADADP
ncbi:MAG TPA: HEAT repeat domain-containing protein, partial [Verrucomicrobiae bacterium]|nr:HEAT repeat domain-containing protein [Verrucomicrobiae bacterium]